MYRLQGRMYDSYIYFVFSYWKTVRLQYTDGVVLEATISAASLDQLQNPGNGATDIFA